MRADRCLYCRGEISSAREVVVSIEVHVSNAPSAPFPGSGDRGGACSFRCLSLWAAARSKREAALPLGWVERENAGDEQVRVEREALWRQRLPEEGEG